MDFTHDEYGQIRLADEECWQFLAKHSIGRIGIVQHGWPMIFPVNYALDGESVVFRTAPGTKLDVASAGGQVAFEVDETFDVLETGTSVMVHGELHRVTKRSERERLEALGPRTWAPGHRDHFVRVTPVWVSGRRIPVHSLAELENGA